MCVHLFPGEMSSVTPQDSCHWDVLVAEITMVLSVFQFQNRENSLRETVKKIFLVSIVL